MVDRVRQLEWLPGRPSIWVACEFSGMRELRRYFKEERRVARGDLYVSSYWKLGNSEDQHKVAKRVDSEAQGYNPGIRATSSPALVEGDSDADPGSLNSHRLNPLFLDTAHPFTFSVVNGCGRAR